MRVVRLGGGESRTGGGRAVHLGRTPWHTPRSPGPPARRLQPRARAAGDLRALRWAGSYEGDSWAAERLRWRSSYEAGGERLIGTRRETGRRNRGRGRCARVPRNCGREVGVKMQTARSAEQNWLGWWLIPALVVPWWLAAAAGRWTGHQPSHQPPAPATPGKPNRC